MFPVRTNPVVLQEREETDSEWELMEHVILGHFFCCIHFQDTAKNSWDVQANGGAFPSGVAGVAPNVRRLMPHDQ